MSADPSESNSKITDNLKSIRSIEINSAFTRLSQKTEMTHESMVSSYNTEDALSDKSLELVRPTNHVQEPNTIHRQIVELRKQQQLQQQFLLQQFQVQQQQLAEKHELQLRQHLKELYEQKRELEEKEQREKKEVEKKETIKKNSSIASSEVKQILQGFLLSKKHREAQSSGSIQSPQSYHGWGVLQSQQSEPNVMPSNLSPSSSGSNIPPYRFVGRYEDDFPLRKTASEPNLLKIRLKQHMVDKRNNPIARPRDRTGSRVSKLAIETSPSGSTPGSGPNSPPIISNCRNSPSTGATTPIKEEGEMAFGHMSNNQSNSVADLSTLYTSPSMPNISLGRPPSNSDGTKLLSVSEAEVRAAFTARLGAPLTGQMLSNTLPYYPTLPLLDTSQTFIQKQMRSLESRQTPMPFHPTPITDTQVAHARLNKAGHRPLGRTQSAPLPLGHPMLNSTAPSQQLSVHYEDYELPLQQLNTHIYLKQQIRNTVLTRVGSRAHLANSSSFINEDSEDNAKVIDLTGGRPRTPIDNGLTNKSQTFLQQQRDFMMRQTCQSNDVSNFASRNTQPLSLVRTFSSPLDTNFNKGGIAFDKITSSSASASQSLNSSEAKLSGPHRPTTGLAFDSLMLKHACKCGNNSIHPEHSGRLQSVWARLIETGLARRCDKLRPRKATLEELQTCHTEPHTLLFGTNPLSRQKIDNSKLAELPVKNLVRLPCGGLGVDSDTTWNEIHTAPAARMAVGCVMDLAFKAALGDIKNGFAIVRPPGHHAEANQAMGFCFFNSIAVACRLLQQRQATQRILIVDWDIHHGNGTQQIFYNDRSVLYISIHRHDDGNFFPGTGAPGECGAGSGLGYNVNISWSGGLQPPIGDAEYLAAFRTVVMPIARDYAPEIVLVSAGFDAAKGHPAPLGGYNVTPACFAYMTQQLMQIADGKVILSLEGGYDLTAICDSAEECVRALLEDKITPIIDSELHRAPCQNAIKTLQNTIAIQLPHWPVLKKLAHTVSCSAIKAKLCEENDTVSAMASLSMTRHRIQSSEPNDEPMDEDDK
ncbi:Histone deacetylase domain,WD40/YVTN repeat-like-containing domain,Histone deacetylase class II [Cinara cedri]|uniref:Histone deacetylase n=1 Tax=Cinara cedri TaxID=506608 RepID=A0A5E4N0F2_9HEMI|nr:Histone deacetylase domain,WD40/YVTN repeat-like-containing domain,Histone deacetylase class II [Cinara cedri]